MNTLIVLAVLVGAYFFPAGLAYFRDHRQTMAIAVLNGVAGWTLVGWIAALVWACTDNVRDSVIS